MSTRQKIDKLVDMLPEYEQTLAYEVIKNMVLAWDSDFTKLTTTERKELEQAELDFKNGEYTRHEDINWN